MTQNFQQVSSFRGAIASAGVFETRVQAELYDQFESAVAFADLCTFLTAQRTSEQAEQLVGLAQRLFEDTLETLQGTERSA